MTRKRPQRPPRQMYTEPTNDEWFAAATAAGKEHGFSTADVVARMKPKNISRARWSAWRAILDANPRYSIAGVARASGYDHTTILYGLRRLAGATGEETRITRASGRRTLPTVGCD